MIMKKMNLKVVACLMAGSLVYSSCIGSFSLFNSYAKWQCNMTSNKFVNAIVGFVLMPIVGGITLFVDAVVLNTIEFWSGTNPMQANIGKTKKVMGSDGRYYAVKTLENGYEVKAPNGELSYFIYDQKRNTWTLKQNGETRELFRFNEDGTITTLLNNGQKLTVTPDEAGLYQVRMTQGNGHFFALR
jgi:hypothetical protein